MNEEAQKPYMRRIRSYVLRAGRMTAGQQRAYDDNWPNWGLEHEDGALDIDAAFGRPGHRVLEIGFGMGQSLVAMAAAAPEKNFIGVEVHLPGVGRLLHSMEDEGVDNIRVYCHDAVEVLRDCIGDAMYMRTFRAKCFHAAPYFHQCRFVRHINHPIPFAGMTRIRFKELKSKIASLSAANGTSMRTGVEILILDHFSKCVGFIPALQTESSPRQ